MNLTHWISPAVRTLVLTEPVPCWCQEQMPLYGIPYSGTPDTGEYRFQINSIAANARLLPDI